MYQLDATTHPTAAVPYQSGAFPTKSGFVKEFAILNYTMYRLGPGTFATVRNEVFDDIELLCPPGFVALPDVGGDLLLFQVNGSRDHKVAIGGETTDNAVPANLQPGEAGLRKNGRQIILRVGAIEISADGEPLRYVVTDQFMALFNAHTHGGGPPPDDKMSAAHLSKSTTVGGAS